ASSHWGRAQESDVYYKAAFLFVADETGGTMGPGDLIDEAKFKDIVAARSDGAAYQDKAKMALNATYMWPWQAQDHFRIETVPSPGAALGDHDSAHVEDVTGKTFWRIHESLTHELLHKLEKKTGRQLGQ